MHCRRTYLHRAIIVLRARDYDCERKRQQPDELLDKQHTEILPSSVITLTSLDLSILGTSQLARFVSQCA